ncbi:MAG: OmpA family protein [Kofleriaceae bacterium]
MNRVRVLLSSNRRSSLSSCVASARALTLALIALLAIAGCKKALDLTKYSQQATELVQKYAPQLTELSAKLPELAKRAGDLPDSVPGATAVKNLLAKNQDAVTRLQGILGGLTQKVGIAVNNGNTEEVQKTLAAAKSELGAGVVELRTNVDAATADLGKAEALAAAGGAAAPLPPMPFARTLASGVEIKGAADGVEGQLLAFIEDAGRAVDKTTWFNFDRLTFQTGKAELDLDKSREQLANISEILKAFPAVTLKIGGYTDNVGQPQANLKLSGDRAQAVVAALVAAGVAKERVEGEGYGAEHPVCPANDTEACRAKNRRIAVSVRSK